MPAVVGALALVLSLAIAPAAAQAGPSMDIEGSPQFIVEGGLAKLRTNFFIECLSVTGTGEFESATEGTIALAFHGCEARAPEIACTSAGQAKGTVTTTAVPFRLALVEAGGVAPAILIGTNEGHFASYSCGAVPVALEGNGVIGQLTAPEYNEPSATFAFILRGVSEEEQEFTTLLGEEAEYGLEAIFGGGSTAPAVIEATPEARFAEGGKGTLTE